MVAIIALRGGGGCLPTPRGTRRVYIYGETIPLHLCRGWVVAWVAGFPLGGLLSPWLELVG